MAFFVILLNILINIIQKMRETTVEQILLGKDEPVINEKFSLSHALSWYTKLKNKKDSRKYLLSYLKLNDPKNYESVKNVSDTFHYITLGWVARCITRGWEPDDLTKVTFDTRLKEMIEIFETHVEDSPDPDPTPVKKSVSVLTPEEKIRFYLRKKILPDFDHVVDLKDHTFDVELYLRKLEVPVKTAAAIIPFYTDELSDLEKALKGIKEYREYYPGPKSGIMKLKKTIQNIVDCVGNYIRNEKIRKPRQSKKNIAAKKQLSGFHFKQDDNKLNLSSKDHKKIIGSTEIYFADTSRKRIWYVVAEKDKTIDVQGTTLINLDVNLSGFKKIPLKYFPSVAINIHKTQKRYSKKIFGDLVHDMEKLPTHRTNKNLIILNIF